MFTILRINLRIDYKFFIEYYTGENKDIIEFFQIIWI